MVHENCLRCGYSLHGLPERHTCPECGMPYDVNAPTWRMRRPIAVFSGFIGAVFGVVYMINMAFSLRTAPPTVKILGTAVAVVFLGSMVWVGLRTYRLYRKGPMAVLTPMGLFLRIHKLDPEIIPWSNISRIEVDRSKPGVHVFIRDARFVKDVTGVFKDREDAGRFVELARKRMLVPHPAVEPSTHPR